MLLRFSECKKNLDFERKGSGNEEFPELNPQGGLLEPEENPDTRSSDRKISAAQSAVFAAGENHERFLPQAKILSPPCGFHLGNPSLLPIKTPF